MISVLLSILALFIGGCVASGGAAHERSGNATEREFIARLIASFVFIAFALAFLAGRFSL